MAKDTLLHTAFSEIFRLIYNQKFVCRTHPKFPGAKRLDNTCLVCTKHTVVGCIRYRPYLELFHILFLFVLGTQSFDSFLMKGILGDICVCV